MPVPILILFVSLYHRLPRITEATDEIIQSVQLRYEVEREKVDTSDKEMKIAMNNWKNTRKRIPDSYDAVSDLIIDLNRFASSRGFDMSYTMGELVPDVSGEIALSLLPINLKLKVKGINTNQHAPVSVGLVQFVELLHGIVESYFGVDLSKVVVKGMGEGIRTMDVSINLWVGFGNELQGINEV
ncbi:dioxygenase [Candidatus Scalindua japonica]|uniref:Dioxygenase n=2 Tax=Candidatus Scalindua japonica TaxID=1284222 RepID=A0A286U3J4_9BACT|nr:dioxygenase [Candidatus Scalindua japonica]